MGSLSSPRFSKAAWKSARGSCKLTPALHQQSSNQEEARVFENRGEEREKRCQTKGCAVLARRRCEMSLVVEKNEKVCGLYTKGLVSSSLQHPPPARKRGGDAICGPTLSWRQGAQLPVDPLDVRRRRWACLGALP